MDTVAAVNDSTLRYVRLLVGLLLVTSPLYGSTLDVTGPDHEYETARLVAEDGRLRVVNGSDLPPVRGVDGIDCLFEQRISRQCVHDAGLLNGTRRADHPRVLDVIGTPRLRTADRYVAFTNDAPVYERTVDWRNGGYVLGLERVPAAEAFDDVATDVEHVSSQVRAAIEEGSVRTDEPLSDANRVVETEDGYFFVYQTGRSSFLDAKPKTERYLEWAAVLFGVVLLRRD